MILVKTRVGQSRKHGLGLFADQLIPRGTSTWEYVPWFDISYTEDDLKKMSEPAREAILWYAYFDPKIDKYILPSDDQRFINHSASIEDITIESTPDRDVAIRDIQPGEELLCDYNKFDNTYFKRRGIDESTLK